MHRELLGELAAKKAADIDNTLEEALKISTGSGEEDDMILIIARYYLDAGAEKPKARSLLEPLLKESPGQQG